MEIEWEINKRNELADPEFGLSIIPVSSAKIPFSAWKKYQKEIAPVSNWLQHFQNQGTVGIITGKISGNLVCIDIDLKNDPRKSIYDELVRALPFELIKKPIIQTTPKESIDKKPYSASAVEVKTSAVSSNHLISGYC